MLIEDNLDRVNSTERAQGALWFWIGSGLGGSDAATNQEARSLVAFLREGMCTLRSSSLWQSKGISLQSHRISGLLSTR